MTDKKDNLPTTQTTLNLKEQAVCDAFLRAGGSMTMAQAYATQFSGKGCAYRFFRRGPVSAYIGNHQRAASERTGVSVDRTLREAAMIAFANIKDVYKLIKVDENDNIDLSEVPDWIAAAIQSVTVISRQVSILIPKTDEDDENADPRYQTITKVYPQVKLLNKQVAIDMMFRVLGSYKRDGSNPHVDDALAALVKAIGERGLPKPGEIVPPPGVEDVSRALH